MKPKTRKRHPDEPVEVATAPNAVIGAMWVELLRSEGIMASLKCDDVLAVAYLVPSPYSCDILVPPSQARRATEILESLAEEETMLEPDDEADRDS